MKELAVHNIDEQALETLIARAFEEDIRSGDVTTDSIVNPQKQAKAVWQSKDEGIVAGLPVARMVFQKLDSNLEWYPVVEDSSLIKPGADIVKIQGQARAVLTAERIALNLVQRISGIATITRKYVEAVKEYDTQILDTRKTVPGLRTLDKYAVAAGGGGNHRMGLFDLAMIKDNHIVAAGDIAKAVKNVRTNNPEIRIEVETKTLNQVKEALDAGADIIMLDNMNIDQMSEAVHLVGDSAETEASGGITLETVAKVAATGVDFISVGALTHSVAAFDISQQLQEIF
ncbi:nicotinate-nucleotide pyrophosphorylase [carboxylating] [Fodinibius salinus]|uniref:Probable nicotinate-nucleotide pyrophosphorylase [carboxylating] n=1 Tax=Fodinibius salinus TaxID=860790 RepID=A0A5D3YHF4_9BACT|nr:carboxylating nicotinate-nucleotide diphosphorylase [Fodinibius salinus]TYP91679.1 nicotinate-nucleotide pyrophosphorylase [carboxylating] [Fodinibius salinus]